MTANRGSWTDAQLAHLVLRLTLGLNIAVHGLSRIAHPMAFAEATVRDFEKTWLPALAVKLFALCIPFLELAVGAAVALGFRLRVALTAGGLLMAALTFGTCLRQAWEIAGLQLIYAMAYFFLLRHASDARGALG